MRRVMHFCSGLATAVVAASLALGMSAAGRVSAATLITVDTTSMAAGNCSVDGLCTLPAALAQAAGTTDATIVLPAGTFAITSPLALPTTGVTIVGAGATLTLLDGGNDSRLFDAAGGSVSFADLTLTHGFAEEAGAGAMFATATHLSLDGVRVADNMATGDGGAIGMVGGSLTITDSVVSANFGQTGGAVFVASAAVTVANTTFAGNGSSWSGAAMYVSFPQSFSVASSTFTGNAATRDGGALGLEAVGDNGVMGSINGSTFSGNDAAGLGGAVFVRTASTALSVGLTISASTFDQNSADAGGALALNDPPVVVSGSSFTGNTSSGSGGAIATSAVLTVNNGAFTGNTAGESGGAIASGNALVVNGPTFTGNHADALGGALELLGNGPTIVGTFSGNTADGAGPVAYWGGRSTLIIAGVDPADIDAPFAGGPVLPPPPDPPTTTTTTTTVPGTPPVTPPSTTPATGGNTTTTSASASAGPVGPGPTSVPPAGASGSSITGLLPRTGITVGSVLVIAGLSILLGKLLRRTRRPRLT